MIDIIYSSIEDYLKKATELGMYATQLSSGKFLCCQKELKLPKLIIGNRYVSTSLLYQFTLKQDCFYIAIPKGNAGMLVNGQQIELNQLLVFTVEQEMLISIPQHYCSHYIIIPTVKLAKYFDEGDIALFKNATRQQIIGNNVCIQSENNQKHLCSLIETLLTESKVLSYQGVLDTQETIIELLCKLLAFSLPLAQQNNISRTRSLAIVNRALSHIHKNDAINITSPELADISFCSLRNLEYAFKSVLRITPKQYLIKRRLQLIHLALKSGRNLIISKVIKNFGIANEGRFAQDYFKFYNEYPHQTRDGIPKLQA
jgi:AraC-like DNA-binding protein